MPRAVLVLEARAREPLSPLPLAPGRALVAAVSGARGVAWAREIGARAVNDGEALQADLGGLVDLRALDAPDDTAGALAHAKGSLWVAQQAHAALIDAAQAGGALYVVVTDLARGSAVSAALHGLLKTAALEWPEVACCALDIDVAGDTAGDTGGASVDLAGARALAEELRCGFRDVEVARRTSGADAGRFVPVVVERPTPQPTTSGASVVDARAVLVASGGARGVTATTLLALARSAHPALLLLGRTPLVDEPACCRGLHDEAALKRALVEDAKAHGRPIQLAQIGEAAKQVLAVREIAAFLAEVAQAGGRAMYRSVDVRSVDEVSRACADARAAFGPITGIVHGAGVLADKRIEDKTAAQVDRVMDTKVLGLHALLEATRADPLRLIALFSSVAGRFGNVGQVDYAMANEALNEMAVRLARTPRATATSAATDAPLVKSFNWGPWQGGMVTPALKKLFLERGVRVLSHADGARHFIDELAAHDGAVEVVFGGELAPTPPPAPRDRGTTAATATAGTVGAATVRVSAATHPAYGDHAIGGIVVLPAAGALELIARATGATSFTDVRVLRGIKLARFHDVTVGVDQGGDTLEVRMGAGGAALFLPGAVAPSYSAVPAPRAAPLALAAPARTEDASARFGSPRVYGELLFHGPLFHCIDAVELMTHEGCVARVRAAADLGWGAFASSASHGLALALDVGALDAALQLALLWARHQTGGAFLPTSIARVDAGAPRPGPLRAVLRGRSCDGQKAVVDVTMEDAAGHVVLAVTGAAVHRLADDNAFASSPLEGDEGAHVTPIAEPARP